jgi:K+ transporter
MEPDTVRAPDSAEDGTARPAGDGKWPWPARLLVTVALLPVGAAVILAAENDLAFIGSWFDPLMIALMIATVIVAWTATGRSQR